MFKTAVIRQVAQETRLSQRVVGDVITASQRLIGQTLREGKQVVFPGFGTFYSRMQPKGTVRHIRTGQTVEIPARRVAAFRVDAVLKTAVRGRK